MGRRLSTVTFFFYLFYFVNTTRPPPHHPNIVDATQTKNIIIKTDLGDVRGTTLTSSKGKPFYAFRGMRYAQPPIGDLRFQPPQPAKSWNGVYDATIDGPRCPQPTRNITDVSEDCLRINVYTHSLPTGRTSDIKKPVVVYLHQGGFYVSSGQSWNFAGPLYFMDRDVVFVTLNYRLGTLGFLATGTPEAPGNNGLKDQVMALKWVQSHIAKFGGDPNSVTLLGYSAGARSITLHMISPMSRNLFHKAIVMSASATSQWQFPGEQVHLAKRQARILKCPDGNIKEMIDCLKTKPAADFGSSLGSMFEFSTWGPVLLFKPVIEPDFGQERFLTESPTDMYNRGDFMRIPIIAGITQDEFASPAIAILRNETLRQMMDDDFDKWAPVHFLYEKDTQRSKAFTRKIREFYLNDEPLSLNKSLHGLVKVFADGLIGFPVHRLVLLAGAYTKLFHYCFTYQRRYSYTYYPDEKTPYGVVHHDDLLYLLTGPNIAPVFTDKDPERKIVERMTRMVQSFAYTGDPNNPLDEYWKNIHWQPFNVTKQQYLDIGEDPVMKEKLYIDRYNLWEEFFPIN